MDQLKSVQHAEELIRSYSRALPESWRQGISRFARIAFFLEEPNEVIVELKKLEAKLQERFSQRFGDFETKRK